MIVFLWIGTIGAWLLFAGPVYQASVELREEGFDREEGEGLRKLAESIPPPERDSPWWWLLPPVAYVRAVRRGAKYRRAVLRAMPADARERFLGFQNKANGWLIVAVGALAIAVKETAELVEELELPLWALVPGLLGPFLLSVGYTVYRALRTRRYIEIATE